MNSHDPARYAIVVMMRQALVAGVWLVITVSGSLAQRATGTISGRVVTEDGQPVPHATVNVISVSGGARRVFSGRLSLLTNEEGVFQAEGLDPMPYTISARAPGYVMLPAPQTRDPWGGSQVVNYSFVGENVTITLTRGGVITGRIINALGEPVIGVSVRAARMRDEAGQPLATPGGTFSRQTDDRGIYRFYGLLPGAYIVSAGGTGLGYVPRLTPYDARLPVYHPSATRDTATEVTVRQGDEITGIDIRYRGERGFAISGKVLNAPSTPPIGGVITTTNILLRQAATGQIITSTVLQPGNETASYAFHGVPNGEYEVVAGWQGRDTDALAAVPRRVTINGRDVSGIDLTLAPAATLKGTVLLEKPSPATAAAKCATTPTRYVDEVIVHVRVDDPNDKGATLSAYGLGGRVTAVPSDKGEFTVRNLKAGRHRFAAQLPADYWYLKAIKQTLTAGAYDVARHGLTLKTGERAAGVQLTIAPGAASVQGKVAAPEGASLPRRVRVYLVPAEAEAKDNLLRFAEARAESDGAFRFDHLAPGKYLLVARPIPDGETPDRPAAPLAWDLAERAKLRKEAEAANVVIELSPCQRVTDFALRFGK